MGRPSYLSSTLLIIFLSTAIYANTLKNGFVYDDEDTVVNNTLIRDLGSLPKLLEGKDYFNLSGEKSYRPVVTFSYFLDYAIFGLKPWGYHLTNILLHAINGVMLYIFLILIFRPPEVGTYRPLLITLLFVAHPVLTEAVNAISFREDLLAFLFYMATLNLYLISRSSSINAGQSLSPSLLYSVSCLLYFLAILSKEMAVTLPFVICCYEWVYAENKKGGFRSALFNRYNIGYALIIFIYAYFRFFSFYHPARYFPEWGLAERLLAIPWLILDYIKLAVFPVSLSAEYVIRPVELIFSSFIASSAVIVFLLALAFIAGQKERGIAFGTLFFILTLVPVYNIMPIANPFAERYLYLPIVGFVIVAESAISLSENLIFGKKNLFIISFILIVLGIYSFIVVKRNTVWRDEFSLWSDAVRKMPQSYRVHFNLGKAHDSRRQTNEAMQDYQAAIRLNPGDPRSFNNLGVIYAHQNQLEKAAELYQTAIRLDPDGPKAHYNLAETYFRQGRLDDAVQELNISLRFGSDYPGAHNNLGVIYGTQGRLDDAMREYEIVLRLDPEDATARYNMGVLYLKKGLKEKARTEFEATLKLRPDFQDARKALEQMAL